ncbi:acyltransferase [Cellulomonas sp. RIT-PI-Y]|uniref:acyltransferase family protein n=1 Tax=Cellulomonas sp. RIT-PI-Y TaxID=3035297 RepID=UPI0021D91316|nr:acyltransferase [Cellulomonas sp. RIT-PI-Y]
MSATLTAPVRERSTTPDPARPAPPARDPYVDGIRAVGILAVVALHWSMVEASWDGDRLVIGNALGHGWAWLLTWSQPLPVLFFAAGVAARHGWRRAASAHSFLTARVRAMLPALGGFALIWAGLVVVLPLLGIPDTAVRQVARIAPQPLWFLGVQVVLLALTPVLVRAGERWGWRVPVALGAAALAVDLLRFGAGIGQVSMANLVLVWAVPYVIGLLDAEARMAGRAGSPRRAALVAVGGLAATVVLIVCGPYPVSLIGMPGDAVSNLAPPTAPVLTFAVAQVAFALALRPRLAGRAARSPLVAWANARSMGLYLWHLTAMFLLTGLVLFGFRLSVPEPWTAGWWLTRLPVALAAWGLLLGLLRLDRTVQPVVRRVVGARR